MLLIAESATPYSAASALLEFGCRRFAHPGSYRLLISAICSAVSFLLEDCLPETILLMMICETPNSLARLCVQPSSRQ